MKYKLYVFECVLEKELERLQKMSAMCVRECEGDGGGTS